MKQYQSKLKKRLSSLSYILFLMVLVGGAPIENKGKNWYSDFADNEIDPTVKEIIDKYRAEIPRRMKSQNISGLSFAIVCRDGVIWAEGFGFTDINKTAKVDYNTVFSMQSVSKSATGTALMLAVQKGLVDLDTPITEYLPDFTVKSRFEKNPEKNMTLRLLLSHKAGFTHEAPIGNNYYTEFDSFEEHIKSIYGTWLRFPVGQRYSYSNLGIDLAGYIIGKAAGMHYWDFVKNELFNPLGLQYSSFDWDVIEKNKNRAIGHSRSYKKVPLRYAMIPSGSWYSNALDVAKFIQFHLNRGKVEGKTLLAENYLDEMHTVPFPIKHQTHGYGLGILNLRRSGSEYYGHSGGGFGFLTHMSWYTDHDLGIVMLTNSVNHNLMSLPDRILLEIIQKKYSPQDEPDTFADLKTVTLDRKDLQRYAGNYIGRGASADLLFEGDRFGMKINNRNFEEIKFISETEALVNMGGSRNLIRFINHADGSPERFVTHTGGTYDFNDSPNLPKGPNKDDWDQYIGKYVYTVYEQIENSLNVSRKNGYLYLDNYRLTEYQPGHFFTCDGESLYLKGDKKSWRNISLRKKS